MELLLIRHGQASAVGSPGVHSDEQRDLTSSGAERIALAAAALNRLGLRIDAILASPYPRASHTAQILCERLDPAPRFRAVEQLRPESSTDAAIELLESNAELRGLAVCGHEPNLSSLVDRLLGSHACPSLIFHTGSIAYMRVDFNGRVPAATLRWFIDSDQLALIAQAP